MNIAVYCASGSGNDNEISSAAEKLGSAIASRGHGLVFGASNCGLMKTVAEAALAGGANVTGVVPDVPGIREQKHPGLSGYVYTDTMAERKTRMIELSDAAIALPGGPGTLDEISEVICLSRLKLCRHPVAFVNTGGYYNPLTEQFRMMVSKGFLPEFPGNVLFSDDPDEILDFLEKHVNG